MSENDDRGPRRSSRRKLLGAGAAVAAGAAGTAMAGLGRATDAHADAGDPLVLGQPNDAGDQPTNLEAAVAANAGLRVISIRNTSADGQGLSADASDIGIVGNTVGGRVGVIGFSMHASGWPNLGSSSGVVGITGAGVGVAGLSQAAAGSPTPGGAGIGVSGMTGTGIGVVGRANDAAGTGVRAVSPGLALDVQGRVRFSTVGNGTLPNHALSVTVTDANVSSASHVMVTLTSDPGPAVLVRWVDIGDGKFTVYTNIRTMKAVNFRYLVVN